MESIGSTRPMKDEFLVTRIENYPGTSKQQVRADAVAMCKEVLGMMPLYTGVDIHNSIVYVTLPRSHSEMLANVLDGTKYNSSILSASTQPVDVKFSPPDWFTNKSINSTLRSIKISNFNNGTRADSIHGAVRAVMYNRSMRFLSVFLSNSNSVAFVVVEKHVASSVCQAFTDELVLGARLTACVVGIPEHYIAPLWFREEFMSKTTESEESENVGKESSCDNGNNGKRDSLSVEDATVDSKKDEGLGDECSSAGDETREEKKETYAEKAAARVRSDDGHEAKTSCTTEKIGLLLQDILNMPLLLTPMYAEYEI